jgi:type II secretory pathway component PulF
MNYPYKYAIYDADGNCREGVVVASSHDDADKKIREAYLEFAPWFEIESIDIENNCISAYVCEISQS